MQVSDNTDGNPIGSTELGQFFLAVMMAGVHAWEVSIICIPLYHSKALALWNLQKWRLKVTWRQVGDATAMVMELGMEGGIHRDKIVW
jgi:hypothetical protein